MQAPHDLQWLVAKVFGPRQIWCWGAQIFTFLLSRHV